MPAKAIIAKCAAVLCIAVLLAGCQGTPPAPAPVAVWPKVAAGKVTGTTLTLNANATISVTGDLIIETDDDLIIKGKIELPTRSPGNGVSLTLRSNKKKVLIDDRAYVGGGGAATGKAGTVLISGVLVEIHGEVFGNDSGTPAMPAVSSSVTGDNALKGGDVIIEAVDGVLIGSNNRTNPGFALVHGGSGGDGGSAMATDTSNAIATGGNGGPGGDVIFQVRAGAGPAKVTVTITDDPVGGDGGNGGGANAYSDVGSNGGSATGTGGNGGTGGTVTFPSALVVPPVGQAVGSGAGGRGGPARASAANGDNARWFDGYAGGAATAKGGDGAATGSVPVIPLQGGGTANGVTASNGTGGRAIVRSGNGGNAGTRAASVGGASGAASAQEGARGGGTPPAAKTAPSVGTAGKTGSPGASLTAP